MSGICGPAASATLRYDALGASDAVGVGASTPGPDGQPNNGYVYRITTWLTTRYPHWTLENRGVEGLTAPEIRDQELSDAVLAQPQIVTVWSGGNDVLLSVLTPEPTSTLRARFEDAFTTILRRLRTETPAQIVTANLPDLSRVPAAIFLSPVGLQLAHNDCVALNESIGRVAALYGIPVVDLFSDPLSYVPANLSPDGFHPNDQGYLNLATLFEAALRAIAWRTVSGLGDVNGDGSISLADAATLLSLVAGTSQATDRQAVAGDASPPGGDNALGIGDAVVIARRAAGLVPDSDWH